MAIPAENLPSSGSEIDPEERYREIRDATEATYSSFSLIEHSFDALRRADEAEKAALLTARHPETKPTPDQA